MSLNMEFEILQSLVPELEAEGYEVFVHPNKPLIPKFLGDFEPDALALRPGKNLAIEVLKQSPRASKKLELITPLFRNQEDWELRIIWITSNNESKILQIQSLETVGQRINEITKLALTGHTEPSLLMAWATFEALARVALNGQFARPQTPGRIVEVLATEGYVTPTEAELLRKLADKRNRLIHGELNVKVSDEELSDFFEVLETMCVQVATPKLV